MRCLSVAGSHMLGYRPVDSYIGLCIGHTRRQYSGDTLARATGLEMTADLRSPWPGVAEQEDGMEGGESGLALHFYR